MKKVIGLLCLIFLFILYLVFWAWDNRPKEKKMMRKAIYNAVGTLENRYPLYYISRSESENKGYYNTIGTSFKLFQTISKEDGRKILVDCVKELLKEINSNTKLLPYLKPSPFTAANIEVTLYVYQPDGAGTLHPDIAIFLIRNEVISYQYYTEEKENYKDALKIIRSAAAPSRSRDGQNGRNGQNGRDGLSEKVE